MPHDPVVSIKAEVPCKVCMRAREEIVAVRMRPIIERTIPDDLAPPMIQRTPDRSREDAFRSAIRAIVFMQTPERCSQMAERPFRRNAQTMDLTTPAQRTVSREQRAC